MSLRLSSEDFSFSFKNFRTSWCRQNFKAFRLCHIHLILICRTFSYLSDNKLVKCDTTALCIEPPAGPVYGPCGADKEARTQLEISWRLSFYMKARKRLQKTAKGPSYIALVLVNPGLSFRQKRTGLEEDFKMITDNIYSSKEDAINCKSNFLQKVQPLSIPELRKQN